MTFVVATGFVHRTGIVERTVVAFLGMNYMDIPAPVHVGDTVSAEMEVIEKKELDREDAGFVTIDSTLTNQEDTVVFEGDMKFMIKRKNT